MIQAIRWRDVLDVAIVAYVLYRVLLVLRGTLAMQMLAGLGVLVAARFVAREADLQSVTFIVDNFWAFWVVALIVLFQPELRRTLAQAGRHRLLQGLLGPSSAERRHVIEEVARAARTLAGKGTGALIVLERAGGLRSFAELGVRIDALVSAELLGSLFLPASPLHDGAVMIQDARISAGGCFLPLSRNLDIGRSLGTRHRAALGLSEETDAVVIVVSEETGRISLAVEGRIETVLDPAALDRRLGELLAEAESTTSRRESLWAGFRRLTVREKA